MTLHYIVCCTHFIVDTELNTTSHSLIRISVDFLRRCTVVGPLHHGLQSQCKLTLQIMGHRQAKIVGVKEQRSSVVSRRGRGFLIAGGVFGQEVQGGGCTCPSQKIFEFSSGNAVFWCILTKLLLWFNFYGLNLRTGMFLHTRKSQYTTSVSGESRVNVNTEHSHPNLPHGHEPVKDRLQTNKICQLC